MSKWPDLPVVADPVKNCGTCAHYVKRFDDHTTNSCMIGGTYCEQVLKYHPERCKWQQKPKPRSLLQWLYDTFLRLDF